MTAVRMDADAGMTAKQRAAALRGNGGGAMIIWMLGARIFSDRRDAGRKLAAALTAANVPDALVLGLPRCGVPVAAEVAAVLCAELDVALVRAVRASSIPSMTLGFVIDSEPPTVQLDRARAASFGLTDGDLSPAAEEAVGELARRRNLYRAARVPVPIADRTTILVDQTIENGDTMRAAIALTRQARARRVLIATPCGTDLALARLAPLVDDVVCLERRQNPHPSACFDDARQITHEEVIACLVQSL